MFNRVLLFIQILLLSGTIAAQNNYTDPFKFNFKKISQDIYLAYRPDPLKVIVECNSTIIINDRDVVVFDATGSPRGARQIVEKIKTLTDKPVSYLINSHGHGDHTLGNQEFTKAFPNCEIISRKETREYMSAPKGSKGKKRGIAYVYEYSVKEEIEKRLNYISGEIERIKEEAAPGYEKVVENLTEYLEIDFELRKKQYNIVTVTPPTLLLENKLTLYRGEREIQILYLGIGDTPGDVWLFLPNEKILCAPDAVVHPVPYGFSRHQLEWSATLKKVMEIDFEILIPGHGEIQYGKQYLSKLIEMLDAIHGQVKNAVREGKSLEETQKMINPQKFLKLFNIDGPVKKYYFFGYTIKPIIERTYDELINNK